VLNLIALRPFFAVTLSKSEGEVGEVYLFFLSHGRVSVHDVPRSGAHIVGATLFSATSITVCASVGCLFSRGHVLGRVPQEIMVRGTHKMYDPRQKTRPMCAGGPAAAAALNGPCVPSSDSSGGFLIVG